MTRSYSDTGAVYRVIVEHLTSDGATVYATSSFGPYSAKGAAKGQSRSRLREATHNGRKARVRIERAETTWTEIHE